MKEEEIAAPRVSVVIPAYNAASFIERTLESVRAQTYRSFEVVVVDDGSTDGTHEVVERWLALSGVRGRCIRQQNKKIAGARNTGMRAAEGKFIALLDHDDLWDPPKLEVVMAEFDRHPEIDLVCHNERVTRDGEIVGVTRNGPWVEPMYESLLFRGNALSPSATVVRRDAALSVGGFREDPEFNTVEDYDFWMRLSRQARFLFIDRVLGEYTLVERAASRRIEYHASNTVKMLEDHFRSRFGAEPGPRDRLRIKKRLAAVYRSALRELVGYGESPELQREYLRRMIRTYPLDPKNLARAFAWGAGNIIRKAKGA